MNGVTKLTLAALMIPLGAVGCHDDTPGLLRPEPTDPVQTPSTFEPPVADAGPDLTYVDLDDDGRESVILDACESEAGSSPISSYVWREGPTALDGTEREDGCSFAAELETGRHNILLTVTDDTGNTANDEAIIVVRTRHPEVWINTPGSGSAFATGSEVRFRAVALDLRGDSITGARLVWESDLDGGLGTGATIRRDDLTNGHHEITVTGTDGTGYSTSVSTRILIADPPTAKILAPADGSSFAVLEDVHYEGRCTDSEGKPVTGSGVFWDPRPCMADPHDMQCAVTFYVPGRDTTTLRCRDANGLTAEVSVTIDVHVSYARNIGPYPLGFGCTECHGANRQEGGVRLDSYVDLTTGGNANGPLIVAGDAGQGILIPRLQAAHHDPDPKTIFDHVPWVWMEPEDIETWWTLDLLAHWIDEGAPDN
jgi:hypothetical protein